MIETAVTLFSFAIIPTKNQKKYIDYISKKLEQELSVNVLQTTLHAQISLISVPEENDFRSNFNEYRYSNCSYNSLNFLNRFLEYFRFDFLVLGE